MATKDETIKKIFRLDRLVEEKLKQGKCNSAKDLLKLRIIGEKIITLCETVL